MPASSTVRWQGRSLAIDYLARTRPSAAYIQATFEAIRGRTTEGAGSVEHGRRFVAAASTNFNQTF